MYIPEFVCGIGAAILAEVALLIVYAVYDNWKKKKK